MRERVSGVLSWAQAAISRIQNAAQTGVVRLQHGQGLAEYALILALIAIVAIIALIFLGGQVSKTLSTVGKSI